MLSAEEIEMATSINDIHTYIHIQVNPHILLSSKYFKKAKQTKKSKIRCR